MFKLILIFVCLAAGFVAGLVYGDFKPLFAEKVADQFRALVRKVQSFL
jgi:hypothetical protein